MSENIMFLLVLLSFIKLLDVSETNGDAGLWMDHRLYIKRMGMDPNKQQKCVKVRCGELFGFSDDHGSDSELTKCSCTTTARPSLIWTHSSCLVCRQWDYDAFKNQHVQLIDIIRYHQLCLSEAELCLLLGSMIHRCCGKFYRRSLNASHESDRCGALQNLPLCGAISAQSSPVQSNMAARCGP